MRSITLRTKIIVLMIALIVVSLVVNLIWSSATQRTQTENELREKGTALAQQMNAVWDFMSMNQSKFTQIAFYKDGTYQGLHCAIAGRSISKSFTSESNYTTRFVNFNPRNMADEPDAYDIEALEAFIADPSLKDYSGFLEHDGEEVFRYLAPMKITKTCLECHGEPVGEIDITGYPKEGWKIGDMGGAISIIMPLDVYKQSQMSNVVQNVLFFTCMIAVCVVIIYFALTYLVTVPLRKISFGVENIERGDLGAELGVSGSSREIDELVARFNSMMHELNGLYEDLENQVADRTTKLERANEILNLQREELEQANERLFNDNRYKSDFLSMMSHELRTPLTSILAFADLLKTSDGPHKETEREIFGEIEANSRILLILVNDILEMGRVEAGRISLEIEPVEFGDVVEDVRSIIYPLALKKNIEFTSWVEPDVSIIMADYEKLRRIMENLLSNAVKFTPSNGSIRLHIEVHPKNDEVWITVSDTGCGIEKDKQSIIFERFMQADASASRRYNGSGLGLSLAKTYAEMHEGSISVSSAPGKGSVFTVKISTKLKAVPLSADYENEE